MNFHDEALTADQGLLGALTIVIALSPEAGRAYRSLQVVLNLRYRLFQQFHFHTLFSRISRIGLNSTAFFAYLTALSMKRSKITEAAGTSPINLFQSSIGRLLKFWGSSGYNTNY
jgi:hypothetical protein